MEIKTFKQYAIFIVCAILIVILSRTIFRVAYNFEFVTALSIAAGFFFKNKKISILVPLLSMFASDLIIGNTSIYLFTWSGFVLGALLGAILPNVRTPFKIVVIGIASGLISTVIFFLWTNLGVVLLTNMYSKNLEGLMRSYINAIPFLQNQLLGNIVLTPLVFIGVFFILKFLQSKKTSQNLNLKSI